MSGRICAALVAALLLCPRVAQAGDSFDNCTGFIDSVPTTISTQGNWCLRKNLATDITSGAAITIATNNVTVDCKGYKLGGLGAGLDTLAYGISSNGKLNAEVKQCNIRGFFAGVWLHGGGGHLVQDNRFDGNTRMGARVDGDGSMIRRNLVMATGGSTDSTYRGIAEGIYVVYGSVDIIDNVISGIVPAVGNWGSSSTIAIEYDGAAATISGNRIRGLASPAGATNYSVSGINVYTEDPVLVSGNHIVGAGGVYSDWGVICLSNRGVLRDNTVSDFVELGHSTCTDGGGNLLTP